jgi:hypothetical protein
MTRSVRVHEFGVALRRTIARTFALDDIANAHRFIETGEQISKIVVTV